MSFVSSSLLAISMSTDAFAVSLSKGAAIHSPKLQDAVRIGAIFGIIEAIAPLFGWMLGFVSSSFVKDIDHWIAFIILCTIGIKFIYESFKRKVDEKPYKASNNIGILMLTALATSVDAFAIGISLAFVDHHILITALSIGFATFAMVTIGIMTGHIIGVKIGTYAERFGGVVLILIGTKILLDHLHLI